MSTDRQDGNVVKNLKEKVQAVTYAPEATGNIWITINNTLYAVWLEGDIAVYPGSIIEHSPYVKKVADEKALLCTKVVKVL